LFETLSAPPETLLTVTRSRVVAFAGLLAGLRSHAEGPIGTLVEEVFRATGYLDWVRSREGADAEARIEDLREFVTVAQEADREGRTLVDFLEQAALVADADGLSDARDRITLMTVHTSKGLEFPVVFLVGMEEGLFPHRRSFTERDTVEEERRLCYVGMTRARERLYLSRARRRHLFGVEAENPPSRFLREIPANLLEVHEPLDERSSYEPRGRVIDYGESQLADFDRPLTERAGTRASFPVGTRVRHPTLGEGVVRATEGSGDREKVTVMFGGFGIRKLAVAVARLEALRAGYRAQ